MTLQILFAVYPIILAAAPLLWTFAAGRRKTCSWGMTVTAAGSVILFSFLSSPWAFTSYYLRYVFLALFLAAAATTWRRSALFRPLAVKKRELFLSVPLLLVFVVLNAAIVASWLPPEKPVSLSFPLGEERYYVVQGGSSRITNPFHSMSGSPNAVDIVRLNRFGNRARGIAPAALADYEIFGDTVLSPCDGRIVGVTDGLPDNPPGEPDVMHSAGNNIVIACGETQVLLAHVMRRSVEVGVGDGVKRGQRLARVGNSGNSLEPHLHVSAIGDGSAALAFDGRVLSVNSVLPGNPGR